MGCVCCANRIAILSVCLVVVCVASPTHSWEGAANLGQSLPWNTNITREDSLRIHQAYPAQAGMSGEALPWNGPAGAANRSSFWNANPTPAFSECGSAPCPAEYLVKMAYGRTFGTCTELDYATVEVSKRVKRYAAATVCGPAVGEVQFAVLGSYVVYYEGALEKLKRLDFRDGYEFAGIPKGRFTFPAGPMGMSTYLESGVGMSYVSETFRNSGSRWNWSLLGGIGFEKCAPGNGVFSVGVQWRHLSNGNMWGKGDELHNSNSGTDMVQGMASFLQRF